MENGIKFTCTLDDYKMMDYLTNESYRMDKKIYLYIFLTLFFLLDIFLFYSWFIHNIEPLYWIAWSLLLIIIFITFIMSIHRNNIILDNFKICQEIGEHNFSFDGEYIRASIKYKSVLLPWKEINKIIENKNMIIFCIIKKYQIKIPKRVLDLQIMSEINKYILENKIPRITVND